SKDNAKAFADKTTEFVMNGAITPLVNVGAHNFVLGGFSKFSGLPLFQAELALFPSDQAKAEAVKAVDAYAQAYFADMQNALRPYGQQGNRFFLFDLAKLGDAVAANPAKYGFTGADGNPAFKPGFMCPSNDVNPSVCGATRDNPTNNNPLQYQYYFGPD